LSRELLELQFGRARVGSEKKLVTIKQLNQIFKSRLKNSSFWQTLKVARCEINQFTFLKKIQSEKFSKGRCKDSLSIFDICVLTGIFSFKMPLFVQLLLNYIFESLSVKW